MQVEKQMERPTTKKHIQELAQKFEKVYSEHPGMFWHIKKHTVELPFDKNFKGVPHRSRAIPMDAEHVKLCNEEIDDLEKKGLIKKSKSEWACFGFYVNKHSEIIRNKPRLVINYKPLNEALAYDAYPLPKPSSLLAKLKASVIFSKFDLKSGFWQVCIHPKDTYKTGFTVPRGHYEWLVMPFGLKNAPSAFQRIMDETFKGLQAFCQVYIDDLLVFSNSLQEHFEHLNAVLRRVHEVGLVLSKKKAEMFKTQITFLGRIITAGAVKMMKHSLEFIDKLTDKMTDKVQLQRFLGCLNYISGFYENCADDRQVLNRQLRKTAGPWNNDCTKAVQ